jgi:uncharacterized protein
MTNMRDFQLRAFAAHPLLYSGHLQTLAAGLLGRQGILPASEQLFIAVEPGSQVRCDCSWQINRQQAPTAVIVHGLGGSSHSPIVITMASQLWTAGMNIVRYNMRNCGGTEAYAQTLHHSGMYGDVMAVVQQLITSGFKSIVLIGFSAGGNLVLNTAGMYADAPPAEVRAVAAVSGAMDVAAAADALHEPANRLYEWNFVRELVELFKIKCRLFPEIFNMNDLQRFRSVREFDHAITAPYSGYAGADEIYAAISSSRIAQDISLPTLILHAKDDPFIHLLPATRAKLSANPNIFFCQTEQGGHCGFISRERGTRKWWTSETVIAFISFVLGRATSPRTARIAFAPPPGPSSL